jgi:hypothetical protein
MTTVKLQYWPVLSRDTTINGKLIRGGYKRTALALQEREEKLVRLETRARAILTWGGDEVNLAEFSLNTGRCIGNPDWVMMKESRKALRKLARGQFPKETVEDVTYFPSGESITTDTAETDLAKREPGTLEDMRLVGPQGVLAASVLAEEDRCAENAPYEGVPELTETVKLNTEGNGAV